MKNVVLFIGDFKDIKNIQLLNYLSDLSNHNQKIVATGLNIHHKITSQLNDKINAIGYNSMDRQYYQDIAVMTIITVDLIHFRKTKKNQKIIYCIDSFNENCFEGVLGDIDEIYSTSKAVIDSISKLCSFIKTHFVSKESFENEMYIIANMINKSLLDYSAREPVLIICMDEYISNLQINVLQSELKKWYARSVSLDMILFSGKTDNKAFRTRFVPDHSKRTDSFLERYDGVICFVSSKSKASFKKYAGNLGMQNCSEIVLNNLCLEEYISFSNICKKTKSEELHLDSYVEYLQMLEQQYVALECRSIKVSVIIPRYNTSIIQTERAIKSAFAAGHENVEVLVIDDGSAEDISEVLMCDINDERLRYIYYSENKGPGIARNCGIQEAVGDYIAFLDADDILIKNSLLYSLAHCVYFNIDMFIGRRILLDKAGHPIAVSFPNLCGQLFKCYYASSVSAVYNDTMVTNKLIKKSALLKHNLSFLEGLFEDIDFSSKLYTYIPEYHFSAVPYYGWYQYGKDTSVSSSIEVSNLIGRIQMEEISLDSIPDKHKNNRVKYMLNNDFTRFFFEWEKLDDKELGFRYLRQFYLDVNAYIDIDSYPEKLSELVLALHYNDRNFFEFVLLKYFGMKSVKPHNVFVVKNRYHIFIASLLALNNKKSSRLVIINDQNYIDNNLLYNLRSSNIFESVRYCNDFGPNHYMNSDGRILQDTDADTMIKLHGMACGAFDNCDYCYDDLYVFSFHTCAWYYIALTFPSITKLEDYPKSFVLESKKNNNNTSTDPPFEIFGELFPKIGYDSEYVKHILVSKAPIFKSRTIKADIKEINYELLYIKERDKIDAFWRLVFKQEISKEPFYNDFLSNRRKV